MTEIRATLDFSIKTSITLKSIGWGNSLAREPKTKRVLKLYRLDENADIGSIITSAGNYEEQELANPDLAARIIYQKSKPSTPSWKDFF